MNVMSSIYDLFGLFKPSYVTCYVFGERVNIHEVSDQRVKRVTQAFSASI